MYPPYSGNHPVKGILEYTRFLRRAACILLMIMFTLPPGTFSQTLPDTAADYAEIFGSDYDFALELLQENGWWADTLNIHGLDPGFTLAIVFPELIRYSSILDYIETRGLEVLYVQYGRDYADFSIGYFQMKPSFAEHLEADILQYRLQEIHPRLSLLKPSGDDTPAARRNRVAMLKEEYGQLLYLEAFMRVMDTLYGMSGRIQPPDRKLRFYATAYNTGYFKDFSAILDEMDHNRFYLGMEEAGNMYSYSDISLRFYIDVLKNH